ncbi:MaoC family dehydratase [Desulfuromonas acetoxidans]|uniref:MaoC-like dehydratase n=1 Tax=Desulfuromonas acetoxidans (strain DSM 684 / 11070) TaxID=281689 RepID=Q1K1X4_DESA6|nr:MaoC family dehydratase [Desulfuromonas acetoxidans]EAT16665.1 MaoC-like dehydratase [Desulfuromonas acetoxidans DSM 684]MBF0647120.1 MaoC family dehydratase [Desulfuromonas acetoxidans]NVD24776.1 MaoC family dehydratase [Desulfuromonas acetoxidans]NVE16821.1 MaoC family dehydratase [Desulfuromonas acetoxidans]
MDATRAIGQLIDFMTPKFGTLIHTGPWLTIDQQRIDAFADVTGDEQWIHTDPQRAKEQSPYGTTIAHGYLTLSLLPFLTQSNHPDYFSDNYPGMRLRVNYGLNKVRFPSPVKVDSALRAHTTLASARALDDCVEVIYSITVEIQGEEKPACVAEFVARLYP